MRRQLVPLVEGKGEVESVPVLLRRLLEELGEHRITVARPFRVRRNRVVREGELERAVAQAIRDREDPGAVLILLDADDDCPAELGPRLVSQCAKATDLPAAVVLASRELEAWFLGAKESLRGVRGIRADATPPANPETIRGAKERLTQNMEGRTYLEVDDQPALAARFDMHVARQACPSFNRFLREVARLVSLLRA